MRPPAASWRESSLSTPARPAGLGIARGRAGDRVELPAHAGDRANRAGLRGGRAPLRPIETQRRAAAARIVAQRDRAPTGAGSPRARAARRRRARLGAADVPALAADPAGADRPAHRRRRGGGAGRLGLRLAARRRHRRARLRRRRLPPRGPPRRPLPARPRPRRGGPLPRRRHARWRDARPRATPRLGRRRRPRRRPPAPDPTPPLARPRRLPGGHPGTYLANAIAAIANASPQSRPADRARIEAGFGTTQGLVRRAGDPGSGLDSAAAWAVRPFPQPALFPAVRRTLLRLARRAARASASPRAKPGRAPTPGPHRRPGAPGASPRSASGRAQALRLLADLRRAATPAGALPERVDAETGIPVSTTPLAWSHAFAILALRELWP